MKTIQQAQRHRGPKAQSGYSQTSPPRRTSQATLSTEGGLPAIVRRGETTAGSASGGKNSAFLPGFTLLEVMIATALFGLVVAGTISVYIMCSKIWHATSLNMQTVRQSSLALNRMVYGVGTNSGLRAASAVTLINSNDGSWRITVSDLFGGVKYIDYSRAQKKIRFWPDTDSIICNDVSTSCVTTNVNGMVGIQLTVEKRDGMIISSNTVSTSVKLRNKP